MIGQREGIKNNKQGEKDRIEQPYRHLLCIRLCNGIFFLFFHRRKRQVESIRPRSLNDPFTILPFGVIKKYYDGSVALYIYFVCYLAIPKFLFFFFSNKKTRFIFIFFHNLNIVSPLVWKQKSLWRWNRPPDRLTKIENAFLSHTTLSIRNLRV